MSVIHEALEKKGIDCVKKMQAGELPHIIPLPPGHSRHRLAIRKRLMIRAGLAAGTVLLFLTIFGLGAFISRAFRGGSESSSPIMAPAQLHPAGSRTAAPVQPAARKGEFVLTGIIEGERSLAVINDQVVGAGDRIGSALVKEIQGRRVILESRGKEIRLSLR